MIKKLFKILLKIVGSVLGLAVLAYAVLLVINWRDQPPSDIALEFAASIENRPAVADEENAHVYISEFLTGGIQRYPEDTEFAATLAEDCQRDQLTCLDAVAKQNYGAKLWLEEQQWILDRYIAAIVHTEYLDPIPKSPSEVTPWGDVSYGRRLLMISAMVAARDGDEPHAIALLEADLRFWRMLLAESDFLLTKMIAAAFVRNHFMDGNRVLIELHAHDQTYALPTSWLKAISPEERSLERALAGEWVFVNNYLRSSFSQEYIADPTVSRGRQVVDWVEWQLMVPLLQPQDSMNRQAAMFATTIELLDVPYRDFAAALEETEELSFEYPTGISRLYNLAGALHVPLINLYGQFHVRVADLEGVRRAAAVTTLLREQQVPVESIADRLAASPYSNPYTDAPFEWDADTQEILFDGLREDRYQVYRLRY